MTRKLFLPFILLLLVPDVFAQRFLIDSFDIRKDLGPSDPIGLVAVNNKLVFRASDHFNFNVMFETDGNTMPVMVNNPDKLGMWYDNIFYNGLMYYGGSSSGAGVELCSYDGNNPPFLRLDIKSGAAGSEPTGFVELNGKLYFTVSNSNNESELAEYDPTANSVKYLGAKSADTFYGGPSAMTRPIVYNNNIYFLGNTKSRGQELYVYAPSQDTIHMVADLSISTLLGNFKNFHVYNSVLYFIFDDIAHGNELWSYNGVGVPIRLTDLAADSAWGVGQGNGLYGYKGYVYFEGVDTVSNGTKLFRYDIANDTAMAFHTTNHKQNGLTWCRNFIEYGGNLFFSASDGIGNTLWMYDGVDTPKVMDFGGAVRIREFSRGYIFKNKLFFVANGKTIGTELYKLQDTALGIKNFGLSVDATVYPNPTSKEVYLDVLLDKAQVLSVQVVDINGRLIYESKDKSYYRGKNTIAISMQQLPVGTYFYRITANDGVMVNSGRIAKE